MEAEKKKLEKEKASIEAENTSLKLRLRRIESKESNDFEGEDSGSEVDDGGATHLERDNEAEDYRNDVDDGGYDSSEELSERHTHDRAEFHVEEDFAGEGGMPPLAANQMK